MFKNVVSTQELLSDSQRGLQSLTFVSMEIDSAKASSPQHQHISSYSSDSALFSFSQRQRSQNEFSQVRTQDLFTQNQTCGSQSESSFPATKKMSMYDKWMSKGAMFKKDQTTAGNKTAQLSFQQQAKDKDDRELLQQIVNIVQDCNQEVKCTLSAVNERIQPQSELAGEKLSDTLKAFLEDIWKHEDRMLKAVEEKKQSTQKLHDMEKQLGTVTSQSKEKLHDLEKQLAVKDAEIRQLQGQLEERGKQNNLQQVAKAVRQEMLSPQLAVENKLMEILEATRGTSEQQSEQLNQYKQQMTVHARQYNELKTFNQRYLKDMEKRLQKDLATLRKDLQKQEQELQSNLQYQLTEANSTHTQNMEQLIEQVIAESTIQYNKQQTDNKAATPALVANMKKEIQTAMLKQTESMEKKMKELLGCHLQKQKQQLQNLHEMLLAGLAAEMESAKQCQDKENDELGLPLTLPVFEEKFEEYHSDLKQQLEEMHEKHAQEVKRIQEEYAPATSTACVPYATSVIPQTTSQSLKSAQGFIPRTRGYQLQRRKEMALVSPLSQLERSSLFSKTKPSASGVVSRDPPTQTSVPNTSYKSDSDIEITFKKQSCQPAEYHSKKTGKKRKKSNLSHKKKCSAKKTKSQGSCKVADAPSVPKPQNSSAKASGSQNTAKQMEVYDFSQEDSPDQNQWQLDDFQLQRNQQQRNQFLSPEASTVSCRSSPAMSVTVDTELVLVRRSRWKTSGTPARITYGANDTFDMLSTPCLAMSQRSLHQEQVETGKTEPRRRSQRNRIL